MDDYIVVKGSTTYELTSLVVRQIHDGWIPQGGVSHYQSPSDNSHAYFMQAMVKTKDPHDEQ